MFRTAFRAAFGALLGLAALVSPAAASQIIYTLTGNTSTGAAFTVTGTGDTTSLFSFLGNVNTPTVALTSDQQRAALFLRQPHGRRRGLQPRPQLRSSRFRRRGLFDL